MIKKLIVIAALSAMALSADEVRVTFQGFGSGTLAGVPFVDKDYVVSMTGDNSAAYHASGVIWLPSTSAAFHIDGVAEGAIVEPIEAFVCASTNECGGFAETDLHANMIWSHRYGVGLLGYDWTTDFGPTDILDFIQTQQWGAMTEFGDLIFTDTTEHFVMEVRVNPVPEPGTIGLLALGVLVCASRSKNLLRRLSKRSS
jgi:hypothetical protein